MKATKYGYSWALSLIGQHRQGREGHFDSDGNAATSRSILDDDVICSSIPNGK